MPTVARRRSLAAPPDRVWDVVSDPSRLPEWWPNVARVEDATPHAWTTVMVSGRGKQVRADWTRCEYEEQRRLAWRQELEESPFERILRESVTAVDLEPEDDGGTGVRLTLKHRARGFGRFGFFQLRMAAARQADQALEALAGVTAEVC